MHVFESIGQGTRADEREKKLHDATGPILPVIVAAVPFRPIRQRTPIRFRKSQRYIAFERLKAT